MLSSDTKMANITISTPGIRQSLEHKSFTIQLNNVVLETAPCGNPLLTFLNDDVRSLQRTDTKR